MSQADLAEVWARSLEEFSDLQIEPHQRAWLRLTRPLGLVENTALIATPNEFVKEQLETRLRGLITAALSREFGRSIQLAVTVDPATVTTGPSSPHEGAPSASDTSPGDPNGLGTPDGPHAPEGSRPADSRPPEGPGGYRDRGYQPQPGQDRIAAPGSPLAPGHLDGSVLAGPAIADSPPVPGRDTRGDQDEPPLGAIRLHEGGRAGASRSGARACPGCRRQGCPARHTPG